MNLLAHAWLSFHQPELLVGNMIADYVKGKQILTYSPAIQQGIKLHRAIDAFTDAHPATAQAKLFFKPAYRLYASAFADVVYDHFLANDTRIFPSSQHLDAFAQETYATLNRHLNLLPPRFAAMVPYMASQNWLFHYHSIWGMQKSFGGLVRRSAHLQSEAAAVEVMQQHYDALQECYTGFFPAVEKMAFELVTRA
jgi:acyl carrier protein phosphodiesterase